ncbi:MAG: hypothetical protein ACREUS_09785 [Burkholderiales bacterium]
MRLIVILALALAACTPMQWAKQDAAAGQVGRDEQECRQIAWREASTRGGWYYRPVDPVFARDSMGRGFFIWPSGSMVDPFGYQLLEENRLAQFCMESKGYTLVPAPKQ